MSGIYFEVLTPLGVRVRTTSAYWARIVTFKHPIMRGREVQVQATLREPEQIRRSRSDPSGTFTTRRIHRTIPVWW